MGNTEALMVHVYAAFNRRDIDGVFARMRDDVNWPKASEGGVRAVGKDEIRAYWTRQWQEFDPLVEPVEVVEQAGGKAAVRVHQVVKSLSGETLFDGEVWHVYSFVDGLIERMDIEESGADSNAATSASFSRS